MGWAYGTNFKGEEIGYAVVTICEYPGCDMRIDKGLAYCCGDLEGAMGERGCGGYFCGMHLFYGDFDGQRCEKCAAEEEGDE